MAKSGNSLSIISDEGDVYILPLKIVDNIIKQNDPSKFFLMTRMPFGVSVERFGKSPIWDPEKKTVVNDEGIVIAGKTIRAQGDGLSKTGREVIDDISKFGDKVL